MVKLDVIRRVESLEKRCHALSKKLAPLRDAHRKALKECRKLRLENQMLRKLVDS